jgi:hypothetical protein
MEAGRVRSQDFVSSGLHVGSVVPLRPFGSSTLLSPGLTPQYT